MHQVLIPACLFVPSDLPFTCEQLCDDGAGLPDPVEVQLETQRSQGLTHEFVGAPDGLEGRRHCFQGGGARVVPEVGWGD